MGIEVPVCPSLGVLVVGRGNLSPHLVELLAKGVTGQRIHDTWELLRNSNSELNVCYVQLFYVI